MKEKIKHIITALQQSHDIDVSKYDETFLLKSFQNKITEKKIDSEKDYLEILENDKKETELFINALHNNYTEFFRNSLTFSVLEKIIFPQLIQKKIEKKQKEIRVWSAACASGQEVYSLAILLEEIKNNDDTRFSYRIFATDKSEENLSDARNGKFNSSDLNNVNLKRIENWFTKKSDTYFVKPVLKKNIHFSQFDLFDEKLNSPSGSIFGDFDVVVCANLLFYDKDEYRKMILKKIKKSMSNQGFLITGEAEREILLNNNFKEVFPHSAIFRM